MVYFYRLFTAYHDGEVLAGESKMKLLPPQHQVITNVTVSGGSFAVSQKLGGGDLGRFRFLRPNLVFFFFLFFSFLATPRASRIHFLPLCSSEDRSSLGGFRESGLEDGGRKRKFDDYLKSEKFTIGINNSAIATWQVQ